MGTRLSKILLLSLCIFSLCPALSPVYSSTFVYYPILTSIQPVSPPVYLQEPPYTTICTYIYRASRGAITYTDFEGFPSGWASYGGSWSITSNGYKGNALQGSDNNQGLGGASQYYYNTQLDSYSSLWITVKTRSSSGSGYYGITVMNFPKNRAYTIEISTTGRLMIRSFHVEEANRWYNLSEAPVSGYDVNSWYNIVVNYSDVGRIIYIYAWLYDKAGNLVAQASAKSDHKNKFTPAYIGIGINDVTALFEDFVISTSDPRYVSFSFQNIPLNYIVEVWDNLNTLIDSLIVKSQPLDILIIRDAVIGTGSDGKIIIKYPDGSLCLVYNVPVTDAIVGGDTYMVITYEMVVGLGSDDTSAQIYAALSPSGRATAYFTALTIVNSDVKQYHMRLLMDVPSSSTGGLTAYIRVMNGTHSSDPIIISGGSATSPRTSWIALPAYGSGSINVNGYFQAAGSTATINLYLQYSTLPEGGGVTVYYPISIHIAPGG